MDSAFRYCPRCATALVEKDAGGKKRPACPSADCGFVHWGNPTPVVGGIVEKDGSVLLVRAKGWPEKMFGLVTGFLEAGETPEEGMRREVKEELGLDAEVVGLVGVYPFEMRNEVIVAYHLKAKGEVQLGDELEAYKAIPIAKLRPWAMGTGLAVKDWLARQAIDSAPA